MRFFVLLAAAATMCRAQSTVTTYRADYTNGGFTQSSSTVSSDHTNEQVAQSINAQAVPLEQHESRVIRSDANGSVTESILRRYDATGQLVSTERTLTDTHKQANGDSSSVATTYRSDLNGSEQLTERSTTNTHVDTHVDSNVAGSTTTSSTVLERPSPGGATLQPVEKRSEVTQTEAHGKDQQSTSTESIYRSDGSSDFREAERKVTNETVTGNRTVQDTADYLPGLDNGSLQLQERRVSATTSAPGGDQTTLVDVYSPSTVGNVQDPDAKPQLRQQEILTRVKNPDGSVVDTLSVRNADASASNTLGAAQPVTRTVCTGKCGDAPAAPPAAPAAAVTPAQSK